MWASPLRRRSKRPWERRSRCRLPSAANFTSLRSSPSAGLWSGVLPGWTRTGAYGRTASDISIPVCSSSISLSWHFCLEDREHVLRGASFQSTEQLMQDIEAFVKQYNENAAPFVWRKREVKGAQLRNTIVNLRDLQNSKLPELESSLALFFQALGMGWRNAARYGIDFSLFCPWQCLAGCCGLVLNSVSFKSLRFRLTAATL